MPKKSKETLKDTFTEEDNDWQEELKKFKPLKKTLKPINNFIRANSKKNLKPVTNNVTKKLVGEEESSSWEKLTKNFKPLPAKFNNIIPKEPIKLPILPLNNQKAGHNNHKFQNYEIQVTNKKDLRKIKTNKLTISKVLDLHSYTVLEAKTYFYEFILMAVNNNYKLVQVITGKGNNSKGEKGVLRLALLEWLTDAKLKPYILSYSPIFDSTGSYGAFYIFLRKKI